MHYLGLACVFGSLLLVAWDATSDAEQGVDEPVEEVVISTPEAAERAGLAAAMDPSGKPLTCDTSTACFDIATDGGDISHILVSSGCATDPSDFLITVDGEPVGTLHTEGGPCPSLPRDIWFRLEDKQDTAFRLRDCCTMRPINVETATVAHAPRSLGCARE
jgi:hypothetical protein